MNITLACKGIPRLGMIPYVSILGVKLPQMTFSLAGNAVCDSDTTKAVNITYKLIRNLQVLHFAQKFNMKNSKQPEV